MSLTALAAAALAAQCQTVTTVETVDIRPGMEVEAREYYRRGWMAAREEAVRRGVIQGFELLVARPSDEHAELVLITRYADTDQFDNREANFAAVFDSIGLSGPIVVDGKARDELLERPRGGDNYHSFSSDSGNCLIPGHPQGG